MYARSPHHVLRSVGWYGCTLVDAHGYQSVPMVKQLNDTVNDSDSILYTAAPLSAIWRRHRRRDHPSIHAWTDCE